MNPPAPSHYSAALQAAIQKFAWISILGLLASCNTLEKASRHGFNSGNYRLKSVSGKTRNVYVSVENDRVDLHGLVNNQPDKTPFLSIPNVASDSAASDRITLVKKSLDVDLTAILLKYRPSVDGLPGQMTTDFNIALYAGWRHDSYIIKNHKDPLGKVYNKIINRGYDFGIFAGPGATPISPFTTRNQRSYEYSGLIIQTGVAGFLETNVASFGLAVGIDHLMNEDRYVWIYDKQPWVGFIIGIALN